MNPPLLETVLGWTRVHRRRRALEQLPALGAGVVGAALAGRLLATASGEGGLAVFILGGLGALALVGRRLHGRWSAPRALAARADRSAGTHDLLQTALAIEAGTAQGDPALARAVVAEARTRLADLAPHAVAPLALPRPALGAAAALVALLIGSSLLGRGGDPPPGPAGDAALASAALVGPTAPGQPSADAPADPTGAAPGLAEAPTPRRGGRGPDPDLRRSLDDPAASATAARAAATALGEQAGADDDGGIDPLAAAVSIWTPGRSSAAEASGQLGPGARTGQEQASGERFDPDGDLAAATDDTNAAAGGDAPEGADPGEADADLATVKQGEGLPDPSADGEPEDEGEDGAAPGEGGEEADSPEEPNDRSKAPPESLAGADEELGRGDESAGAAGAGGANDAGGSAIVEAQRRPPDWEVAADWVEGKWREAPQATLEQIEEGRTGRRSSQDWRALTARYAAIAEADTTPEAVPPTRRTYVQRYFDALAQPTPEVADDDGSDR